ncbi:MAG: hypothetical protein ACKN9F_06605 [Methylomonas sp.]
MSDLLRLQTQAYSSGQNGVVVPPEAPQQPLLNAVSNVQASATQPHINLGAFNQAGFAWQSSVGGPGSNNSHLVQSGGLMLIQRDDIPTSSNSNKTSGDDAGDSSEIRAGRDIAGFMNVFVARGGINTNFAK